MGLTGSLPTPDHPRSGVVRVRSTPSGGRPEHHYFRSSVATARTRGGPFR